MKTSTVIVSLIGIALVAGTLVHLSGRKAPLDSTPVAEPALDTPFTRPQQLEVPNEASLETAPPNWAEAVQSPVAIPAASNGVSDSAVNPAQLPTLFSQAIDTLVSPQASFQQKHEAWRQLQDAGQLDEVIEALKQGGAENPASAAYPAALGQAQLYKAGVVAQNGGALNEMGILGMQADQNFDAALKLDPANWEGQFFKAAAMSHWPQELNKGQEVVQRLSSLINQQETLPPQPQFAQTYVLLGDQYRKMGQSDYAAATWQIGAQKFPGHLELRQRIGGN